LTKLKVWGRKSSSNVQALMWCIGELHLPYERIDAGHVYGVVDTPDYLSMNPNARVPTLVDGDSPPLWETGAILRYLANCYAPDDFWPADATARANVDRWAEWAKLNIAGNFTTPVFWRVVRTPPSKRNPAAIDRALAELNRYLAIAESQLSSFRYLAAECLTLADIQFGHCLYRYFDIDIERAELPNLERYYELLSTRPAFREHVMIDYEDLRERD
jgi:glutathione S-transferase